MSKLNEDFLNNQGIVEKTIDGVEYKLNLMTATDAIDTAQELVELVSVPLAAAYDSGDNSLDAYTDVGSSTRIAQALTQALREKKVAPLVKKICKGIELHGQLINFDTFFRGKKLATLPVFLGWAIEENGINPITFGKGLSEVMGADISQTLSAMSQNNIQEVTREESEN